ncbi:hypothetical protein HC928_02275 [bacterium]|nr:hypothetical protein [bacterium]
MSHVSRILKMANDFGIDMAKVLIEQIVMPWYAEKQGERSFSIREELAHTVHEALAGLVWKPKNLPDYVDTESLEFVVTSVEPFTSEDGGFTLMVSIDFRHLAEDMVDDHEAMPLHTFLQNFQPIGQVEFHEYAS